MERDRERMIRELAYSLWESAGRPHRAALRYWLMAEEMVMELTRHIMDGLPRTETEPLRDERTGAQVGGTEILPKKVSGDP